MGCSSFDMQKYEKIHNHNSLEFLYLRVPSQWLSPPGLLVFHLLADTG